MKIKNVKEEDADYLKNYLIEHVNKEEFIFSYEWSKGDICLWDNLSILHMASEIKNCKELCIELQLSNYFFKIVRWPIFLLSLISFFP